MIGAERSGTTLVMAMLGCHSRIAVPEVVWYYSRFHPYLHTYGDLSVDANYRTLAQEMVFGLKTPFWGMKVNPRTIVDEVMELAPERSFAGLYCGMFERFAQYSGRKPRWGEKTPYNLFFVEPMLADFPNAQFIFITRDGRDSCADYLESSFGPNQHLLRGRDLGPGPERGETLAREARPGRTVAGRSLRGAGPPAPRRSCAPSATSWTRTSSRACWTSTRTELAQARGATHDHKPLGHPRERQVHRHPQGASQPARPGNLRRRGRHGAPGIGLRAGRRTPAPLRGEDRPLPGMGRPNPGRHPGRPRGAHRL